MRGNGKIIQELEGLFRGAGWNVIKLIWATPWDDLLAQDYTGALQRRMMDVVDGEYQEYIYHGVDFFREEFFNTPELRAMVSHLSDDQLYQLKRGGHDPLKVYAAYKAATEHKGQPTVILVKTVKGYGIPGAEGTNTAHQAKKSRRSQTSERRTGTWRTSIIQQEIRPRLLGRTTHRDSFLQIRRRFPGIEIPPRTPGRTGRGPPDAEQQTRPV